ncbi:thioredoxin domain-containing protein [Psittacicella hinzii]|uniref:Thiol:disulfide interchange protein n=1 Tax=Psittacicella hinzii TaxID=2028575 RepID=A0A3A1YN46_9GAMM|nr:hypothetical protein [Psittacicella hinzii]RIY38658.1 hypothetical protein CKF58_03630 [Psittacicella hinzii]
MILSSIKNLAGKTALAFAALTTLFSSANLAQANVVAGRDYTVLNQPLSTVPSVSMAMSFSCVHCAEFTRVYRVPEKIEKMLKETFPNNHEFLEWHIVMEDIQLYRDFARLRAVLYATDNDKLLPEAFELPYTYANDPAPLKKWLQGKLKLSSEDVNNLWTSFSVNTFYKREVELTKAYEIRQTPTFIINGKYEMNIGAISIDSTTEPTPDQIGDAVVKQIKQILLATWKKPEAKK